MQKDFYGLIVFLVLGSAIVEATTVSARPLGRNSSEIGMPLCYMRTARANVLDLSRFCGEATAKGGKPQVTVLDFQREGDRLMGRVRNDTGKSVRYAIVNYSITAQSSQSTESRFIYVTPEALEPGQVGTFEGILNELGDVRVDSVEWEGDQKQTAQK